MSVDDVDLMCRVINQVNSSPEYSGSMLNGSVDFEALSKKETFVPLSYIMCLLPIIHT